MIYTEKLHENISSKENFYRFPRLCSNNGTCSDSTCKCTKNYKGAFCDTLSATTKIPGLAEFLNYEVFSKHEIKLLKN